MCKNEEIWIARIVNPLVKVFGCAIVADTGSTDGTWEVLSRDTKAHLIHYDNLSPEDLGRCRQWLQGIAKISYNATHVFLVDGDELYPIKYLEYLKDNPMPENAMGGFTYGIECTELDNGECWLLGTEAGLTGVSRHAFFSVNSKWYGVHPFESPDSFVAGDPTNYYWRSDNPSYHFFHIHQMKRSNKDEDVYLRNSKRYKFSMRDAPEIKPHTLWLKNQEEYKDE